MSELTREQVEYICKFLVEEHLSKDASTILANDAAPRATIEQQAVELERVKFELGLRNEWASLHADDVIRLKRQLAAMTRELEEYRSIAEKIGAEKAVSQLSASQARCQVLEKGFADQTAIRERHEAGFTETIAHLKATLTAREASYDRMRDNWTAAVQEAGRLRDIVAGLQDTLISTNTDLFEARQKLIIGGSKPGGGT